MQYKVSIMEKVLGKAKTKDGVLKIVLKNAKSIVGRNVPVLPWGLVHNDVVNAIYSEKVTFLRETWDGEWNLCWYINGAYKDTFYFVRDISND